MGKTLVVAEKPSVGRDIAEALGCRDKKQGYIEGDRYIVTWAAGHLVTLKEPQEHDESLAKWTFEALPFRFPLQNSLKVIKDKEGRSEKQFNIIKNLIHSNGVSDLVNAGDSGREGLCIQRWIYRMAGNRKPVKVLWLDSFTKDAILYGFQHLHEDSEFDDLMEEAEARAEADYLMGMKYSRAFTLRQEGRGVTLSYGRCQTPLLNLIAIRDEQIKNFKPQPYFNIKAEFKHHEGSYVGTMVGEDKKNLNFVDRTDAENLVSSLTGKNGTIQSYKTAQQKKNAPLLYDLGTLQTDCGTRFGYSPEETLAIAQLLYEKHKILSYPRTDSKYLSTALLKEIHMNLEKCEFGVYAPYVAQIKMNHWTIGKEYVNDKKITDHPALTPTITDIASAYEKLSVPERNVFDLVVRRFLAIFFPPYIYQATEVITKVEDCLFKTNGRVPLSMGYKEVFNDVKEEKENKGSKDDKNGEGVELPSMQMGDPVQNTGMEILDKVTEPPSKITNGNIIKLMEKYNIGTPATRSSIITKLLDRKYIVLEKKKYSITPLGQTLINSVPNELKHPELTNQIEAKLAQIGDGALKKEVFLSTIYEDIKVHIHDIEKMTIRGTGKTDSMDSAIGECPLCGAQVRKIVPKPKEGGAKMKPFYGCMGYKEGCKFALWSEFSGKKFTDAEIKKILPQLKNGGRTKPISGFKKKDGTPFKADPMLYWDTENGRLAFEFPEWKDKK